MSAKFLRREGPYPHRLSYLMGEIRDMVLDYDSGSHTESELADIRIHIRDMIIECRTKLDRVDGIWKMLVKASAPFDYPTIKRLTSNFKGNKRP